MQNWQEIKPLLAQIEQLENRVTRQKMQLRAMMLVSQAIHGNVGTEGLFEMLTRFLDFEMGIGSFFLLFREGDEWSNVGHLGVDMSLYNPEEVAHEIHLLGPGRKALQEENTHPFIQQFEYGLQVMHKTTPLAYLFMGKFKQVDDIWGQMDFVTAMTNIVAVAVENKRLFKVQLDQKVINREVELAAEIQRALVPRRLPSSQYYELSSIYRPHFAVGGDYYDVVEFPDSKIAFCIADITGKGVSAALLMANFQATFHTLVTRRPSLEEIVNEMNAAVHRVTDGDRFITLFLGKYDSATSTLHYINAGHTPPFLIMGGQVLRLRNGTTVLGWLPELPFLEIGGICLTEEALLFTYTDGLTDLCNKAGEDFSEALLEAFLMEHAYLPARELNDQLLNHIEAFRQNQPYPDDITVLTCRLYAGE